MTVQKTSYCKTRLQSFILQFPFPNERNSVLLERNMDIVGKNVKEYSSEQRLECPASSTSVYNQKLKTDALAKQVVLKGLQCFGPAPGAKKLLQWEREAAELAVKTGIYRTLIGRFESECGRIGPNSGCFCGHNFKDHANGLGPCSIGYNVNHVKSESHCLDAPTSSLAKAGGGDVVSSESHQKGNDCTCSCRKFRHMWRRPEELGMWWLPRRKKFKLSDWAPKCRCSHSHKHHFPFGSAKCRSCSCSHFESDFCCLICNGKWEEHKIIEESEKERKLRGKSVGNEFFPLHGEDESIQRAVFGCERTGQNDSVWIRKR